MIGEWLRERYYSKTGKSTKNMDLAISALTEIEARALLEYCAAPDPSTLRIPVYVQFQEVDCDAYDLPLNVDEEPATKHNIGLSGSAAKLAGITKRGMPQPRRKR